MKLPDWRRGAMAGLIAAGLALTALAARPAAADPCPGCTILPRATIPNPGAIAPPGPTLPPVAKPDLAVLSISGSKVNLEFWYTVTIKNKGLAPSESFTYTVRWLGSVTGETLSSGPLTPGQQLVRHGRAWTPDLPLTSAAPKQATLCVSIDSHYAAAEISKANNAACKTFTLD